MYHDQPHSREGCHVLFQQNATVYTDIPVNYSKLCKMYLRWGLSNVKETLAMSRFAFGRFRDGSMPVYMKVVRYEF